MIESDRAIAIAAIALQRSDKLTTSAVRDLLLKWRMRKLNLSTIEAALDHAGVARPALNATVGEVERDIEKGLGLSIFPIPISSDRYPPMLRSIADAPPIIHVRGNLSALDRLPGVAVVGTRKASPHGLIIAERIAEYLSNAGWCVVSGLAMGIDASAHEGSILGGAPTIAVLAHGLEKAQPTANQPLAERILEAGGAWVSEHTVGVSVGARGANFVLRNRIQVGLSCASIIVEGEEQSGSKTQADYCLRNKRHLFAVLPDLGSRVATVSALPRMLVKVRGATPIYSKSDYPAMLELISRSAALLKSSEVPSIRN